MNTYSVTYFKGIFDPQMSESELINTYVRSQRPLLYKVKAVFKFSSKSAYWMINASLRGFHNFLRVNLKSYAHFSLARCTGV